MKRCKVLRFLLIISIVLTIGSQQVLILGNRAQVSENYSSLMSATGYRENVSGALLQIAFATKLIEQYLVKALNNQKIIAGYVADNVDPKPDFLEMRLACAEVVTGKAGGAGTIIEIDDDYLYVLTAKHVVNRKGEVQVQVTDANSKKFIRVRNIDRKNVYMSDKVDMAIVTVPKPKGEYIKLRIAKKNPTIGTKIYTIGHPLGLHYTVNTGIVSNYRNWKCEGELARYMMTSAPAYSGNSGGGCLNALNEVVGIVVGIAYDLQGKSKKSPRTYLTHLVIVVQLNDIVEFSKKVIYETQNSN